jgi:hypothetical protein
LEKDQARWIGQKELLDEDEEKWIRVGANRKEAFLGNKIGRLCEERKKYEIRLL